MATRVEEVVRSAARRRFAIEVVEQLAFALLPVLGGFIVLLLLGTEILHWYWMAAMIVAGLAIAIVRIRARHQTHYQTAQVLDSRLRLDDSLSTAWFLLERGVNGHDPVASFQIQQAETLARTVVPDTAFPFVWRRAWMLTGALAAVAFGLFAVRYLVTGSLSLEQAIAPVQISPVFEALTTHLRGNEARRAEQTLDGKAGNSPQDGTQLPDQKQLKDVRPEENAGQGMSQTTAPGDKSQAESGKPGDEKSGDAQNGNDMQAAQKPEESAAGEKNSQGTDKRQANSAQQGLMDKMKDALSSLMAKMQNAGQHDQQNNQASNDDKAGNQNSGKAQQSQQQQAQSRQSRQDQSADSQSQAQASERTQASQGHSSDAMPEKGADAHSGIGRQDGDKSVKEAEELAAMGKLAEIIGKRSASLTGEMTVETPSGKQQLKTAYSGKMGHHADTGGEINRDDIPLMDQQYVREYMELVRKQSKQEE